MPEELRAILIQFQIDAVLVYAQRYRDSRPRPVIDVPEATASFGVLEGDAEYGWLASECLGGAI